MIQYSIEYGTQYIIFQLNHILDRISFFQKISNRQNTKFGINLLNLELP